MPLGTEVGLGPGDIVLDEDPAAPSSPPPRKDHMILNTFPLGLSLKCALVLMNINVHNKFEMPSFTHSKDMIKAQFFNGSLDPYHAYYG